MIHVYSNNITNIDREVFNRILGHAGVTDNQIRYVDLEHEEINLNGVNAATAVGHKAIKLMISHMANERGYSISQLVGNDVVDKESAFCIFNFPLSFMEMNGTQEDKAVVWNKVQQLAGLYKEWVPFDDPLPEFTPNEQPVQVSQVTQPIEIPQENSIQTVVAEPTRELGELSLDVIEVVNALYEQINSSDVGLGKSLNKYGKFTLHTSSGDLKVYPTNRIPDEDGMQITFKDLVVLVKMSFHMNAGTISFEKKDGTSVVS